MCTRAAQSLPAGQRKTTRYPDDPNNPLYVDRWI
jgi:hypothetical protein